jgi:hypothetical protein
MLIENERMTWELLLCVAVASFCIGMALGMFIERFRIYNHLLKSNDPQSWTAAHKVRVPTKDTRDEDSDLYPPTPTRLHAINPLRATKSTVASEQETVKMPTLKDPPDTAV